MSWVWINTKPEQSEQENKFQAVMNGSSFKTAAIYPQLKLNEFSKPVKFVKTVNWHAVNGAEYRHVLVEYN